MKLYIRRNENWLLMFFYLVAIASLTTVFSLPPQLYASQTRTKAFSSPDEAAKALIAAVKGENTKELNLIFGSAAKEMLDSGDPVEDRAARKRFIEAYDAKNSLVQDGSGKFVLQVGADEWPFPVPIIQRGDKWAFDTTKGKEELRNRRIGRNELNTIQTCLAYVDAQREYASKDRDRDGLFEYAQKFVSTQSKKDGLYWNAKTGEEESPLGDLFARATSEGYKKANGTPIPFHGYLFRILKAQGKNARGGSFDYIVKGRMIGGFAMVAYPTQYGASGVMTFVVNHDGIVYEKNLGRNTVKIAQAMKLFDPDKTWKKAGTE